MKDGIQLALGKLNKVHCKLFVERSSSRDETDGCSR